MSQSIRWFRLLAFLGVLACASPARAAFITVDVAEFTWTVAGATCEQVNPADCLSFFSLTYLWNGPAPSPVVSGSLAVDGAAFGSFFPLDPLNQPFDQLFTAGVPASAQASISFLFAGSHSLTSPLLLASTPGLFDLGGAPSATGLSHLFQVQVDEVPTTVPEPATLATVGLGLLAAWRSRARR